MRYTMRNRVYYEPQSDWKPDDYYYLHRVLHRIFFYYDKHADEIRSMDLSKMSDRTKVLIYCIIKYCHNDFLLSRMKNLKDLEQVKPLQTPLILDDHPLSEDSVYKQMNVIY